MQFWFARGSEVSIREQLVTQVVLGILSDDLPRPAAALDTRTGAALPPASQHHQRGISPAGTRALGRVPAGQRGLRSRQQAGSRAHAGAGARANDRAPVPLRAPAGRDLASAADPSAAVARVAAARSLSADRAGRRTTPNPGGGDRPRRHFSRRILRAGRLSESHPKAAYRWYCPIAWPRRASYCRPTPN